MEALIPRESSPPPTLQDPLHYFANDLRRRILYFLEDWLWMLASVSKEWKEVVSRLYSFLSTYATPTILRRCLLESSRLGGFTCARWLALQVRQRDNASVGRCWPDLIRSEDLSLDEVPGTAAEAGQVDFLMRWKDLVEWNADIFRDIELNYARVFNRALYHSPPDPRTEAGRRACARYLVETGLYNFRDSPNTTPEVDLEDLVSNEKFNPRFRFLLELFDEFRERGYDFDLDEVENVAKLRSSEECLAVIASFRRQKAE